MIKQILLRKKHVFIYFSISYVLLLMASCKNNSLDTKNHLVFRYNEHNNISSLDTAFSKDISDIWATNQLFNGLVQMHNDLNIQPSIAKSWTISENALTYSFLLRNDVFFHKHERFGKDSTRTVNASDFEYSLNRLIDKRVASPGSWVLNRVENFKAINDSVFHITLKSPFPAFLGLLTMKYCSVVPKEIVEFYLNDYSYHLSGTGPYYFTCQYENTYIVFSINSN